MAYLLLLTFVWVVTPYQTIHDVFADHESSEDHFCEVNHAGLGVHVEEEHPDCEILKIDSPVYASPGLIVCNELLSVTREQSASTIECRVISFNFGILPSRAPPMI